MCDCEQCKLWSALQGGDDSLVDHAFALLSMDGGHYEGYGGTFAGAGACYILRVGSTADKERLGKLIKKDELLRRRIVDGLWGEYELGYALLARIFQLSDLEQRFEILTTIDIRDSHKVDVGELVRLLQRQSLKPWEETLLHLTLDHKNWA